MEQEKQMIVVGGPNGAGKTTFVCSALKTRANDYLSADAISDELVNKHSDSSAIRAGRIFVERLRGRIEQGTNLIVESTLAGKSLLQHLERASECGFESIIVYLYLESDDICVARVRHRVSRGGHNVPERDIRRRYHRSLRNFWARYRFATDQWMMYQNSGEECVAVACGRADNYVVFNDESMNQFLGEAEREVP